MPLTCPDLEARKEKGKNFMWGCGEDNFTHQLPIGKFWGKLTTMININFIGKIMWYFV